MYINTYAICIRKYIYIDVCINMSRKKKKKKTSKKKEKTSEETRSFAPPSLFEDEGESSSDEEGAILTVNKAAAARLDAIQRKRDRDKAISDGLIDRDGNILEDSEDDVSEDEEGN